MGVRSVAIPPIHVAQGVAILFGLRECFCGASIWTRVTGTVPLGGAARGGAGNVFAADRRGLARGAEGPDAR